MWWPDGPEVTIMSYDTAVLNKAARRVLEVLTIHVLILDEAHYLKTIDTKRTKFIYNPRRPEAGLASRADYVWPLSGTFSPNHVGEYWTHLRTLFPELIQGSDGRPMGYISFLQEFTKWKAGVHGGIQVFSTKESSKTRLREILRTAGLRRTLEEILPDLPPLVWGTVAVAPECASAELEALEATPEVQALRDHLEVTGDFASDSIHLATLRRLIGRVKVAAVANLVKEELSAGHYEKIVIWAWHKDVVQYLCGALGSWGLVMIDGSVSQSQRGERVSKFQQDPATRIFVGQIQAAGTAITLTAANQVLFAESSWVPDEMLQAAKRAHRFGQTQPVFARIAALDKSVDQVVAATHNRKLASKVEIGD